MNLFLRLLRLRLLARLRGACPVLGPVRTPFRVMPTDLDVLRHMNNGVYLSLMDLGRMDLMIRSGLLSRLRERRWYPVVAEASIRFRRSLELFDRFHIVTRVLGWDERVFFVHQSFGRGDDEVAGAFVAARFLGGSGTVHPRDVLAAAGVDPVSPELPGWAAELAGAQPGLPADPAGVEPG